MSVPVPAPVVTAAQLQARLREALQAKGVLDRLRSQLRNSLLQEVRGQLPSANGPDKDLCTRVAESLIAGYLEAAQYPFSLSVFLPESRNVSQNLLSPDNVLEYFGLRADSAFGAQASLAPARPGHPDVLRRVVAAWAGGQRNKGEERAVQTDDTSGLAAGSLDQKLSHVDRAFQGRADAERTKGQTSLEERMLDYQRECDVQMQLRVKREIERLRSAEIAAMRLEESAAHRKALDAMRAEMDQALAARQATMELRQTEVEDRLRQKEKELELRSFASRQELLERMDRIAVQENEVKRESSLNQRTLAMQADAAKRLDEQLQMRELALKGLREHYERQLEDGIRSARLEMEVGYKTKESELQEREAQLREQLVLVGQQQEVQKLLRGSHDEAKQRVRELEEEVRSLNHQLGGRKGESAALMTKLSSMQDYDVILQESSATRQQLEDARRAATELRAELVTVRERAEQREADLGAAITNLRIEAAQPAAVSDLLEKNATLAARLEAQDHHCADLESHLRQEQAEAQRLRRELEDTKTLLSQARTTAASARDSSAMLRRAAAGGTSRLDRRPNTARLGPSTSTRGHASDSMANLQAIRARIAALDDRDKELELEFGQFGESHLVAQLAQTQPTPVIRDFAPPARPVGRASFGLGHHRPFGEAGARAGIDDSVVLSPGGSGTSGNGSPLLGGSSHMATSTPARATSPGLRYKGGSPTTAAEPESQDASFWDKAGTVTVDPVPPVSQPKRLPSPPPTAKPVASLFASTDPPVRAAAGAVPSFLDSLPPLGQASARPQDPLPSTSGGVFLTAPDSPGSVLEDDGAPSEAEQAAAEAREREDEKRRQEEQEEIERLRRERDEREEQERHEEQQRREEQQAERARREKLEEEQRAEQKQRDEEAAARARELREQAKQDRREEQARREAQERAENEERLARQRREEDQKERYERERARAEAEAEAAAAAEAAGSYDDDFEESSVHTSSVSSWVSEGEQAARSQDDAPAPAGADLDSALDSDLQKYMAIVREARGPTGISPPASGGGTAAVSASASASVSSRGSRTPIEAPSPARSVGGTISGGGSASTSRSASRLGGDYSADFDDEVVTELSESVHTELSSGTISDEPW